METIALVIGIPASILTLGGALFQALRRFRRRRKDSGHNDGRSRARRRLPAGITVGAQVFHGPVTINVYEDGLPEAKNPVLRAAFEEGRCLQEEGHAAQDAEKHEEAIDRFTRGLTLAETEAQRAALHLLRGNSYSAISSYEQAVSDYEVAMKLSEGISPAEDAAQARAAALGNLGNVHTDRGALDQAEEQHTKALEIDRQIGNRPGEAQDLGNLGDVYRRRGDLDKAEKHHKKALHIHRETGNRLGTANQLSSLGIVYRRRGNPHEAEQHFKKALDLHRKTGNRLGEASQLGHLGIVYRAGGDLDQAEERHKMALEIHREIGNRLGEADQLGNLGIVYRLRADLDKAEEHHKEALEMDREIGARLGQADQLGNLGILYAERGHTAKARSYLQQADAIYQDIAAGGANPNAVRQALESLQELERQQHQDRSE